MSLGSPYDMWDTSFGNILDKIFKRNLGRMIEGRIIDLVEKGLLELGDLVAIGKEVVVFLSLDARAVKMTPSAVFLHQGEVYTNWSPKQDVRVLSRVKDALG